jgi:4-coumarate--CoA ligase
VVASTNCINTQALIFGTQWANDVISPSNPAYSADELAFQLRDSGAKGCVDAGSIANSRSGGSEEGGDSEREDIGYGR